MNEVISSIILSIIQGITEWIPVSSSGHLEIFGRILDFNRALFFDVALHFGTLMAVFVYFGRDIVNIIRDLFGRKWKSDNGRMGIMLIISCIPIGIIGFLFFRFIEELSESLIFLAIGWAITSMFLSIGSLAPVKQKKLGIYGALLIGIAQVFSLFRGISRSGTTIVTGLWLGLNERDAIKFSYLLSIPIIFGANILTIGNQKLPGEMLWSTLVSFFVSLFFIHISFNYILNDRKNLKWLALYTLILGAGLIGYLAFG